MAWLKLIVMVDIDVDVVIIEEELRATTLASEPLLVYLLVLLAAALRTLDGFQLGCHSTFYDSFASVKFKTSTMT